MPVDKSNTKPPGPRHPGGGLSYFRGDRMTDPQGEQEKLEWYAQFLSRPAAKELQEGELWAEQRNLDLRIDDTGAILLDPWNFDQPVGDGITHHQMISVLKAFLAGRILMKSSEEPT